ncbi:MAG: hypothetical protein SGCHY_004734 [Lobulomycetales sp.]
MTSRTEILQWNKGAVAFEQGDMQEAVNVWRDIAGFSRIHFNLAVAFARISYTEDALVSLTHSVACDPHLAIAYFLRGQLNHGDGRYADAVVDYEKAIEKCRGSFLTLNLMRLLGNMYIDYSQLGLEYRLYLPTIHFNLAATLSMRGNPRGQDHLIKAQSLVESYDPSTSISGSDDTFSDGSWKDVILNCYTANDAFDHGTFDIPLSIIYKPDERKLQNAERIDYLGKSHVIASVAPKDRRANLSTDQGKLTPTSKSLGDGKPSRLENMPARSINRVSQSPVTPSPDSPLRLQKMPLIPARSLKNISHSPVTPSPDSPLQTARRDFSNHDIRESGRLPLSSPEEMRKRSPDLLSRFESDKRGTSHTDSDWHARRKNSRAGSFSSPDSRPRDRPRHSPNSPRFDSGQDDSNSSTLSYDGPAYLASHGQIRVKLTHRDSSSPRMLLMSPDVLLEDLKDKIERKLLLKSDERAGLKLRYTDEDGDVCLITDQEDLVYALEVSGIQWGQPARKEANKVQFIYEY